MSHPNCLSEVTYCQCVAIHHTILPRLTRVQLKARTVTLLRGSEQLLGFNGTLLLWPIFRFVSVASILPGIEQAPFGLMLFQPILFQVSGKAR